MKKRVFAIIITTAMLLGMLFMFTISASAETKWDGVSSEVMSGEGTQNSPYLIESAYHLKYLQEEVNRGNNFAGKYIVLTNNIDLCRKEWTPIGSSVETAFSGVFDGQGLMIFGLSITSYSKYCGLFGVIKPTDEYNCVIANLHIKGEITFDNNDNFTDHLFAGGFVGFTEKTSQPNYRNVLSECVSTVTITINKIYSGITQPIIGGLVGRANNTDFYDCSNSGDINFAYGGGASILRVGGFTSSAYNCTFINCINSGNISIFHSSTYNSLHYVGGIAGLSSSSSYMFDSLYSNCVNLGSIYAENMQGNNICVGGIVGTFSSSRTFIINCYNDAIIYGKIGESTTGYARVGGIAGNYDDINKNCNIQITNSCNGGVISSVGGIADCSGGIVGYWNTYSTDNNPELMENCHTTTQNFTGYNVFNSENCSVNITLETFKNLRNSVLESMQSRVLYDFYPSVSNIGVLLTSPPTTTIPTTTTENDTSTRTPDTTISHNKDNPVPDLKISCNSSSTLFSFITIFTLLGGVGAVLFTKKRV